MDSTRAPVTRSYHVKPPGSAALSQDDQDEDGEEYVYEEDEEGSVEGDEEGAGEGLSSAEKEEVEPEPDVGAEGAVRVSLKLLFPPAGSPDNKQSTVVVRRFRSDSPVSQLFTYVSSLLPPDLIGNKFDLLSGFPRASLLPLMVQTIGEAGLAGSQIMMTWVS